MHLIRNNICKYISFIIIPMTFIGCSGVCKTSGKPISIGQLPTGQSVIISSNSILVDATKSGSPVAKLSVYGLASNQTVTFTMDNPQNTPSLLFAPQLNSLSNQSTSNFNASSCTVTAQSPECTINSATDGANNGHYLANITYNMTNPDATAALNPIPYTIIGGSPTPPKPVDGTIKVSLSAESLFVGNSINVTYTLENSQNIINPITIAATSSAESVLNANPSRCQVTTAQPTCTIIESGLSAGTAAISSAASGYTIPNTNEISVKPPIAYAYITNANTVSRCYVDDAFNLYSCTDTGSGFDSPRGVAIWESFAYVTNSANSTVTKCSINLSTGILDACASTGNNFAAPNGIAISSNYAYVTDVGINEVFSCEINAVTGELTNCQTTGLPTGFFSLPSGISISNNGSIAYVSNLGGNATLCNVNSGALVKCQEATNTSNMEGVSISNPSSQGYVHFTNFDNGVLSCSYDSFNGVINNCSANGNFISPTGIYSVANIVYVTEIDENSVQMCISSPPNGALSACKTTGNNFRNPSSITMKPLIP